ncbi:4Fe-4S binding protein [Clostridioides sp. ES-S-0048-02]|uniref:4Fe-4S binding protein n=1 Tax=Clostridioides sp. ES-S-0048-02 TaxID=2770777 RepID=UPI001D12BAE7|nr:4Fe-4S binding protein [Clostridioides sp. ES-S-0048-02]
MDRYIKNCPGNDKYFTVWDDCIYCGLCAKVCPCKTIKYASYQVHIHRTNNL